MSSDHLTAAPVPGPGARLRRAREQQQLTLAEVAAALHLSVSILEDLEQDCLHQHTAPVFVQGYLRSYAQRLNLEVDEVMHDAQAMLATASVGTAPSLRHLSAALPRRRWSLRQLLLSLSFLLFALLTLWWIGGAR